MSDDNDDWGFDEDRDDGDQLPARPPARLHQSAWGALLLELTLQPEDADNICKAYGTTQAEVSDLLDNNKAFQDTVREVRSRVKALGPNAGFVLRSQALAEQYLVIVDGLVRDQKVNAAIKARLIENVVNWGRMNPANDKQTKEGGAGAAGVVLNIAFGAGLPVPQGLVINAIPTKD